MFDRIKALVDRWHNLKQVAALTDRDLEDLGMSRSQVENFVRMPTDLPDRVAHMAAVFGLSDADIKANHQAYLDLLETCGGCLDRATCTRMLAKGDQAHPADCGFCRNAAAFEQTAHLPA